MVPYGTIQDHMGLYKTIWDHAGSISEHIGTYVTRDHTGPYGTIGDHHKGLQGTLQNHMDP